MLNQSLQVLSNLKKKKNDKCRVNDFKKSNFTFLFSLVGRNLVLEFTDRFGVSDVFSVWLRLVSQKMWMVSACYIF